MQQKRIALLIDCDNVSHNSVEGVLEELAKYGMVNVRHAHGDWKSESLSGWADRIHPFAIRPMQQFAYTKGKNATDAAMIIDAMDLLYSKNIDAFALMTSDSDFTPLALRLQESGFPVYGFGEKKTPMPFVQACTSFIYVENLVRPTDDDKAVSDEPPKKKTRNELRCDTTLVRLLRTATEQTAGDDGWSLLSRVSDFIHNNSSFSVVNYGFQKLGDLIRTSELFDVEMRGTVMFIRTIRKQASQAVSEATI
ncbi:NYN domain-containing protein [Pseudomonas aeruginosa]|uniref:NYN domain-containing protein n=1 Tax=Pseudomonas aeruginosa TaxID=287 RepID=UPI001A2B65C7|nr:NYN domain-containing protein [Pseudomonas aeruginosa]MBG7282109.1 NYN domain-containing protein [Pseudomonas aeruginosa]MDI3829439.1 NYN domain-containing protein [Pseudomonas aeruginosa]MDU0686144.1 NYN domain-containing protein [Pseudomonas aeruginosa]HBN9565023.1 NYN domain-containing protein [Pseudomonas aeruginosa]HBO3132153.1 NYN domain-containing protein [Pseudomonas aeruginosa]